MKRIGRVSAAALAALLLTSLALRGDGARTPRPAADAGRPNLILIVTDDQDLLLDSLAAMPRVRAGLAAEGVTFTQATVPLSSCCPARATLLRGQYAHNHAVYSNQAPDGGFARFRDLGRERKTIATALQGAGYRTALFGKYLNGYPDSVSPAYVPPGWDEWLSPAAGDAYGEFDYTLNDDGRLVARGSAPADYLTDVLAERARRFVAEWSGRRPFFLLLAPYAPHKPYVPAPRHAGDFADQRAPRTPGFDESDVADKPRRIRRLPRLSARDVAALDAIHRDRLRSLAAVDEMVGDLLDELAARGELERTYLVFTSDNGYHLGQHRLPAGKFTAYEEDVRVPLIVRGPGVVPGATRHHLVSQVDVAPTLAELGGARLGLPSDGRSFAPLLRATAPPASAWRQLTLLEQFGYRPAQVALGSVLEPPETQFGAAFQEYPTYRGLRAPGFKYVESANGARELYDLERDPAELRNVAGQLPARQRSALSSLLERLGECRGEECWRLESAPALALP
jgi:arylsulfatase A-like enzyme